MHNDESPWGRAADAKVLQECGAHKLVITDREGNCLAYLLAWGDIAYDAVTDTYVCSADPDAEELITLYTEGDIESRSAAGTYAVMTPDSSTAVGASYLAMEAAG